MVQISEDNKELPVSKCLKSALNIVFSSGNKNIINTIKACENKDAIILFDYVPEVKSINKLYDQVKDYILLYCTNVFLYRIPCIEYYILKTLYDNNDDFESSIPWLRYVIDKTVNLEIIETQPPRTINYRESFKSFEKQCKLALNNLSSDYRNVKSNKCGIYTDEFCYKLIYKLPIVVTKYNIKDMNVIKDIKEHNTRYELKFQQWIDNPVYDTTENWWEL